MDTRKIIKFIEENEKQVGDKMPGLIKDELDTLRSEFANKLKTKQTKEDKDWQSILKLMSDNFDIFKSLDTQSNQNSIDVSDLEKFSGFVSQISNQNDVNKLVELKKNYLLMDVATRIENVIKKDINLTDEELEIFYTSRKDPIEKVTMVSPSLLYDKLFDYFLEKEIQDKIRNFENSNLNINREIVRDFLKDMKKSVLFSSIKDQMEGVIKKIEERMK